MRQNDNESASVPTTSVRPVAPRIDGPPAGRDLDAIIAGRVFGKTATVTADPEYSTDIYAGWAVLRWMSEHAYHPEVGFTGGVDADYPDGVRVTYYDHANYMRTGSGWTAAWGETMPLAACRAALAALESRELWNDKEV